MAHGRGPRAEEANRSAHPTTPEKLAQAVLKQPKKPPSAMRPMRKIRTSDGQEHNVREEDFSIGHEGWNEYKLADGGRLKVKTTVVKIHSVLDDDGNHVIDNSGERRVMHNTQVASSS